MAESNYTESSIKSLSPQEHIRLRPGMYIGKLGSGASPDDGIYVLLKEIIDNSIDEHSSGHGKRIDITIGDEVVSIRVTSVAASRSESSSIASPKSIPAPNMIAKPFKRVSA